jgi:DNA-binding beta-propeller fold protein YncE
MTWQLVTDTGADIERSVTPCSSEHEPLCFPTYAGRAEDGTYVIAEELGIEKQVPFRFECRTIRVDAKGKLLFDSTAEGLDDAYGCLLNDGYMALLRRTRWELLVVSPRGDVSHWMSLHTFSKRLPRYVTWTFQGTLLMVFFNRSYDVDIVEVDRHGQLLWYLPRSVRSVGIVGGAELSPTGTILIADPFRHAVTEIDRTGKTVWQYGALDHPANDAWHCSAPSAIKSLADGRRLVADTRNHRILVIDPAGAASELAVRDVPLCDPTDVAPLANGHYLICDTGNAWIREVDRQGDTVWHYGEPVAPRRYLSYPRSIAATGKGRFVVADTGHDRIVELGNGEVRVQPVQGERALFWPRCVRPLPSGSLLVADARNGRIVELSAEGRLLRQLVEFDGGTVRQLRDPHDVRRLSNGHLLIADSTQDCVLEVDWSGTVYKIFGTGTGTGAGTGTGLRLKDPHSAQELADGSLLISDTGNHRILLVGAEGSLIREIHAVHSDRGCSRLQHPRYAEQSADGTLVIVDTGHNRILGATSTGRFLWEFSRVPDSAVPYLDQPRWATLVEPNELLVSDHFHHRIVHVRWKAGQLPSVAGQRETS